MLDGRVQADIGEFGASERFECSQSDMESQKCDRCTDAVDTMLEAAQ